MRARRASDGIAMFVSPAAAARRPVRAAEAEAAPAAPPSPSRERVRRAKKASRRSKRSGAQRLPTEDGDGSSTEPEPDSSRPSSAESSLRGGTVALEAMEVMAEQREHARRVVDLAMAGTRRGRKTQEQVVVEIG